MRRAHPPPALPRAGPPRRARGRRRARVMFARYGAELVLHGHNHRDTMAWRRCAFGDLLVVGIASGSAGRQHKGEPLARYNLFRLTRDASGLTIEFQARGLFAPQGAIVDLERRCARAGGAIRRAGLTFWLRRARYFVARARSCGPFRPRFAMTAPAAASHRIAIRPLWVVVLAARRCRRHRHGAAAGHGALPQADCRAWDRTRAFGLAIAIANIVGGSRRRSPARSPTSTAPAASWSSEPSRRRPALPDAGRDERTAPLLGGRVSGFSVAGAGINALVGAVARAAPPEQRSAAIAALGIGQRYRHSRCAALHAFAHRDAGLEGKPGRAGRHRRFHPAARLAAARPPGDDHGPRRAPVARRGARRGVSHPSFWLLNAGFFVYGFHVVFYGTHLPAYVADQGLGPRSPSSRSPWSASAT